MSKRLRVLERAGLIARWREAQWRPCRIEAGPLKDVADWTERYRHIWEDRLDRMGNYIHQVKSKEERSHGRKPRRVVTGDFTDESGKTRLTVISYDRLDDLVAALQR